MSPIQKSVLQVRGLSVDIEVSKGTLRAVQDTSFSVLRGETLAIVGESGCGKTITALALMRLLPRRASLKAEELTLEGVNLAALTEREISDLRGHRICMIFQDPMTSLNPVYRIGDQLEEIFLRHGKGNRSEARARAEYLLDRVGVTNTRTRLAQYPHELSGGLRQRMMIAMALMCEPSLIIADEPTTALDVTVQAQILALLTELQREFNMAMILITHDLGVVARVADRVAVMYAGRIVETGTSRQLFASPMHPYTRGLISCIPHPGRTKRGSQLGAIPGMVPALIGNLEGCQFRNRCYLSEDGCSKFNYELTVAEEGHCYRCSMSPEILVRGGVKA